MSSSLKVSLTIIFFVLIFFMALNLSFKTNRMLKEVQLLTSISSSIMNDVSEVDYWKLAYLSVLSDVEKKTSIDDLKIYVELQKRNMKNICEILREKNANGVCEFDSLDSSLKLSEDM